MARWAEMPFQMAGNGYLKAGKGLVGDNFVSLDDIYPYLASKYDLGAKPVKIGLKPLKIGLINFFFGSGYPVWGV